MNTRRGYGRCLTSPRQMVWKRQKLMSLVSSSEARRTVLSLTLLGLTKQQRNKYDRKQERLRKTMPAAIPLHEQSTDLTGPEDDAFVSMEKRQELTKSARVARREAIREENFLRSM